MISNKKLAASLAGVASLFLIAGTSLSAVSANAAENGACVVTGGAVTIDSGVGIQLQLTHDNLFSFVGLAIKCAGSIPVSTGGWTIQASGHSDDEDCSQGSGGGTIDGGTDNNGDPVTGGAFNFKRVGSLVQVTDGTIITANGETHSFTAQFVFTPSDGECSGDLSEPTTHAGLQGAAHVTEP